MKIAESYEIIAGELIMGDDEINYGRLLDVARGQSTSIEFTQGEMLINFNDDSTLIISLVLSGAS